MRQCGALTPVSILLLLRHEVFEIGGGLQGVNCGIYPIPQCRNEGNDRPDSLRWEICQDWDIAGLYVYGYPSTATLLFWATF